MYYAVQNAGGGWFLAPFWRLVLDGFLVLERAVGFGPAMLTPHPIHTLKPNPPALRAGGQATVGALLSTSPHVFPKQFTFPFTRLHNYTFFGADTRKIGG